MFGKRARVDPLESQKQVMIAASDLNRAQLSQEWLTMTHGVANLAGRAKTIGAWASSAAVLLAGFAALRSGPPRRSAANPSWLHKILTGVRVASTLWLAFRGRGHKPQPQHP